MSSAQLSIPAEGLLRPLNQHVGHLYHHSGISLHEVAFKEIIALHL